MYKKIIASLAFFVSVFVYLEFFHKSHTKPSFNDAMGIVYRKKIQSNNQPLFFKEKQRIFTDLYNKNHLHSTHEQRHLRIPKIIHQIWIGGPLPDKYKRLQKTWKEKHPGWEYKFWTDQNVGQLKLKNKKWFDAIKNYGFKADVLRLEILKKYGGVYIDMDTECIKPFDALHYAYDYYAGLSSAALSVANGIIGAIPNHPIIIECIERINRNFLKRRPKKCTMRELFCMVGPPLLTYTTVDYLKRGTQKTKDIIFPCSFFYPWFHNLDVSEESFNKNSPITTQKDLYKLLKSESMSLHYWAGSWWACGENKNSPLNWDDAKKTSDKSFVVVVPSYNNSDWYKKNLDSVCMQNYPHYRVVYIDDNSIDGTGEKVTAYINENKWQHKIQLKRNRKRVGALANIYHAIHTCKDDEIIVLVDGDDWLADDTVLSYLNELYKNKDIWLTYGQYQLYPSGKKGYSNKIPQPVLQKNHLRKYPWLSSHLRTFYAGLFKKIRRKDLLYQRKFFPMAWDLGIMFPMLEMAGEHSGFIPTTLYTYNTANVLNDHKVNRGLQKKIDQIIRSKKSYQPLISLA